MNQRLWMVLIMVPLAGECGVHRMSAGAVGAGQTDPDRRL